MLEVAESGTDHLTDSSPPKGGCGCSRCSGSSASHENAIERPHVYALGYVEARFPSLAVEREFAQALARIETTGKTDRQAFYAVLSQRENRYLARRLCWVFRVQGLETYLLAPHDDADWDLLIAAIRPAPSPLDLDVLVGTRGPVATPAMCNGLQLPIVVFEQLYSFGRDALIKSIPKPEKLSAEKFGPAAEALFDRIMQLTANAGSSREHRALNYLAMRYPAIYSAAAEAHGRDCALSSVEVKPSRLAGVRQIVDVIFAFTNRTTDVTEKQFVRVDVTETFPFMVTKLSPYYDR
jgi:hypothetical protein